MVRLRALMSRVASAPSRLKAAPKEADSDYLTAEHRAWAAGVIGRAAGRCQWPGCTKAAPEHRMVADHIHEMKDGGAKLDPSNGQCLCVAHNTLKGVRARASRHAKPVRQGR